MNAPQPLELSPPAAGAEHARIAALFDVAKTAYGATLLAGALIVAMLWSAMPVGRLAAWYAVLAAVTLARLALHRAFVARPERRAPLAWERRFALGAFAAGLLWAVPVAAFFPAHSPVLQMALALVTAAAVVGAAGVYAASAAAFYGFCLPPTLALVVQFARQPGEVYPLLALGALVFVAAMVRAYRDLHANVTGALAARAEKEALLERVAQSEARLREAIRRFPEGIAVFDEEELRCNDAYRALVEASHDLVWSIDREGRWSYLNPAAVRRIYGEETVALLGRPMHECAIEALRGRDTAVFARVLEGEAVFRHETRHRRGDGTCVDLSFNAVPLRDAHGAVTGATGTARDVSEERRAAAALHENVERLRLAVDAAGLTYWEWDRDSDRLHWGRNPALPGGEHATTWREYSALVHPEDRERYLAVIDAAWNKAGACSSEYRVRARDGREVWISSRARVLADAAGRATRMIGVSQDITERKRREDEERFLAYHDSLTGLPNRRLLDDRLRQALHLAQRRAAHLAVMLVDLDDFKRVNDGHGHVAGDAVLREVGRRLAACVRKADTLARQGGDEFVVVIPDVSLEADCQVVAEKILRALEAPIPVAGADVRIGASIGISLYPADAGEGEALLRNADAAMYRAKQAGGSQYRYYRR